MRIQRAVWVLICAALGFTPWLVEAQTQCADFIKKQAGLDARTKSGLRAEDTAYLCRGAESSIEPGQCLHYVLSGSVSWGGGTDWILENAIALCAGALDAKKRIACFQGAITKGVDWKSAIERCVQADKAKPASPVTKPDKAPIEPRVAAPAVLPCHDARDCDGDGHRAMQHGGDDCDDNHARRYPGRTEVPDPENVDEDCDPATYGIQDLDGDRFGDSRFCNAQSDGRRVCGLDCDDTRAYINPHAAELPNRRDDDCDGVVDNHLEDWWSPGR